MALIKRCGLKFDKFSTDRAIHLCNTAILNKLKNQHESLNEKLKNIETSLNSKIESLEIKEKTLLKDIINHQNNEKLLINDVNELKLKE